MGHKVANYPKAIWNNQGNTQRSGIGNNQAAQRGHPPTGASSRGNRSNQKPLPGGRVFHSKGEEIEEPANIVSGTLLVDHPYARILFDSGTSRSFVDFEFTKTHQ